MRQQLIQLFYGICNRFVRIHPHLLDSVGRIVERVHDVLRRRDGALAGDRAVRCGSERAKLVTKDRKVGGGRRLVIVAADDGLDVFQAVQKGLLGTVLRIALQVLAQESILLRTVDLDHLRAVQGGGEHRLPTHIILIAGIGDIVRYDAV
ncbi:hypothetical protein AJ87_06460 [Rhizobium yanglingense]|nr:hypothetical protein AJ87_06460 [Rhizobium yanglingense]